MDTSLTIEQILLALRDCGMWNKRSNIMVPNLSWGQLRYWSLMERANKNQSDS